VSDTCFPPVEPRSQLGFDFLYGDISCSCVISVLFCLSEYLFIILLWTFSELSELIYIKVYIYIYICISESHISKCIIHLFM
jgi:hypothetical protein